MESRSDEPVDLMQDVQTNGSDYAPPLQQEDPPYEPPQHSGGFPPHMMPHGHPGMMAQGPPMPSPVLPALLQLAAPKPPVPDPPKQSDGPGFPYAVGGYKYGKTIQDAHWYRKTEDYNNEMREAELRATFQLSYIYLYDTNEQVAQFVDSLQEKDIILISQDSSAVARSIFELNVLKHTQVSVDNISDLDLTPKKQIIVLSDATPETTASEAALHKLRDFVRAGGVLLSFNSGVYLLDKIFPKKLAYKKGASSVDKPVEIDVMSTEDLALFNRYSEEIAKYSQLVRRKGMVRFDVIDPSVQTLLRERAPDAGRPLAVKFSEGSGEVFQLNTTHLASKVGAQGGSNFLGLGDMLDAPSKELAKQTIDALSNQNSSGKKLTTTLVAWKAAYNCGFFGALNRARSYVLALDFLFELLRKYLQK